ncbi:MAG: hypothetical protein QOD75_3551 [Blastocatellia bacterium]|jgi:hypothetical protein|nr:hypothetical protein [Blastocatellia bacterium]
MRRIFTFGLVLVAVSVLADCTATNNTNRANTNAAAVNANAAANNNVGNPPRDGVIDTNANIPQNANSRNVSSNTAVVTNNNGNANTAGVKTVNQNDHRKPSGRRN